MSQKISSIAKNTSYFTLALILQKVITFSYFVILARNFLPEDLGKYYFAISFTTIFSIFIDLGLANVLTREVAKDQAKAGKFLSNVLAIKIPLTILSLLAALLVINLLGYPNFTKYLVYISCVSMILDSFTLAFFATLRGFHNLIYESVGAVFFQVVVLFFGFLVIKNNLGLAWQMSVLALASVANFLYAALVIFRLKIKIFQPIDAKIIKPLILLVIPFALYGVFQRLYTYLDTVLLSVLAGDEYVGLYQIAFKIIFALQFLPMAFIASVYPAFSNYWVNNKEQLMITFERAMNYLIIISLPISFGIISISDKIISIFKPEYIAAVPLLNLNMIALIFLFINYPIGSLLNACDRQKRNTTNMAITLAVSLLLNIILIPKYQALGASITVVISSAVMFILGLIVVSQIIKFRVVKITSVFIKALISSLIMLSFVLLFKPFINIFLLVALAGIIYFLIMLTVGGFKKEDVVSIVNSFISKNIVND